MLAFWSKSLVFHGENAGWRKGQKFFKGKVLDGPKSRGEAPPFQSVGFLGKMFGCVWHSMEKLLDGSRGTPSLMGAPSLDVMKTVAVSLLEFCKVPLCAPQDLRCALRTIQHFLHGKPNSLTSENQNFEMQFCAKKMPK